MKKIKILILIISMFLSANLSKADNSKAPKNDYLYSQAYFDYLIECASIEKQEEIEKKKQEEKEINKAAKKETKQQKTSNKNEINLLENMVAINDKDEDTIEAFKLSIENYTGTPKYSETFKKEDSKVIIPVGNKFSFIHNTSKSRNKYNSTDYKILSGGELQIFKALKVESGLETNYRDLDQNPISRKIYIIPELKISNKINIVFPNKYNIYSGSYDHDIGLNISPFKSKAMDLGVYSGLTRTSEGKTTQSINFSTNFYLF